MKGGMKGKEVLVHAQHDTDPTGIAGQEAEMLQLQYDTKLLYMECDGGGTVTDKNRENIVQVYKCKR